MRTSRYKLVLLRHGESVWNRENRFTGWTDVEITDKGRDEAEQAAALLKKGGWSFDIAYTSVLKRAIKTLWITLEGLDLMWIPVIRNWSLNERHYGNLQGLNKTETSEKYGEDQVFTWRRSFDTPPPAIETTDQRHPCNDPRYVHIPKDQLPGTEALKQCLERVIPYWETEIAPAIKADKKVLICAHGNSLRALVKHLDKISDAEISQLNIPTAIPLVYELDEDLIPVKSYYLGDVTAAAEAAAAVANQAKGN